MAVTWRLVNIALFTCGNGVAKCKQRPNDEFDQTIASASDFFQFFFSFVILI